MWQLIMMSSHRTSKNVVFGYGRERERDKVQILVSAASNLAVKGTLLPFVVSIAALCISVLALVVATLNYRRKAGILVRGTFSISSSRAGDDSYVSSLGLDNLKDRTITIFDIYLRLGRNNYIQLEHSENPLLLRAFETHTARYGPIEFYGMNTNKIDLNKLLGDPKIPKRIVLSTSEGKYAVPERIGTWNPVFEYFRNYMIVIAKPVISIYKGTNLGGNIKYVIEIIGSSGATEIIPVLPQDYEIKVFRNFRLTRESLESKEALERLLQQQRDEGTLSCKEFMVYDPDAWREQVREFYTGAKVEAVSYGFFQYHVLGRLLAKYHEWSIRKKNAQLRSGRPQ
jgi:hypothetical protein